MNPYGYIAIGVIALALEVYAIVLMDRAETERQTERLATEAELRQIAEHYADLYPATLTREECEELNAGRWDFD